MHFKISNLLLICLLPTPATATSLFQRMVGFFGIDLSSTACDMLNDKLQASGVDCTCKATVGLFSGINAENICTVTDVCLDQNSDSFCGSCKATIEGSSSSLFRRDSLSAEGSGVCSLVETPDGTDIGGIAVNMKGGLDDTEELALLSCEASVLDESLSVIGPCTCSTQSCSGYQISLDCSSVSIGSGKMGPSTNGCIGFPSFELP